MPVTIGITDNAWDRLPRLAPLAERAIDATLAYLHEEPGECEVSLLLAGDAEAARFNTDWRGMAYAPNVLSFPAT